MHHQNNSLVSLYLIFMACEISGKEEWYSALPKDRGQMQRGILPSALRFAAELSQETPARSPVQQCCPSLLSQQWNNH